MADLFSIASGVGRALWLAELAQALEEAHALTSRLGEGGMDLDLMELHIRIEAARLEINALRLGRPTHQPQPFGSVAEETAPFWTKPSPWQLSDRAD